MSGFAKKGVSLRKNIDDLQLSTNANYLFTFLLLISTLLIYDVIVILNESNFEFKPFQDELQKSVYGQKEAVSIIVDRLDEFQSQQHIVKVLNFVGSTGVGKTFTANIIKKYFEPNVFEIRGSPNHNQQDVLSTITYSNSRQNRLIVFDDLLVDNLSELVDFIKTLPHDVSTLVICIFNIQETDEFLNYTIKYEHIGKIINTFQGADINSETVKFQEFNIENARKWIINEISEKGIDIEKTQKIADSLLEAQNVKFHGLKGLSAKLNLEL